MHKFQAIFHLSEIISEVIYKISGHYLPLGCYNIVMVIKLSMLHFTIVKVGKFHNCLALVHPILCCG